MKEHNSEKIKKIGTRLGYISGVIVWTCLISIVIALTVNIISRLF